MGFWDKIRGGSKADSEPLGLSGDELFQLATKVLLTLQLTHTEGGDDGWLVGWLIEQNQLPASQAQRIGSAYFRAYVESDGDLDRYFSLCARYLQG